MWPTQHHNSVHRGTTLRATLSWNYPHSISPLQTGWATTARDLGRSVSCYTRRVYHGQRAQTGIVTIPSTSFMDGTIILSIGVWKHIFDNKRSWWYREVERDIVKTDRRQMLLIDRLEWNALERCRHPDSLDGEVLLYSIAATRSSGHRLIPPLFLDKCHPCTITHMS